MIIYLLLEDIKFYILGLYIYNKLKSNNYLNIKIIFNLDIFNLLFIKEKNYIIIPIDVKSQHSLFKEYNFNNNYYMLDDKINLYKYLDENKDLLNDIKLIQTYNISYNGKDMFKKFIIKNRNGIGSRNNIIKEDSIYKLIKEYGKDNQIQDIIETKYIFAIRCLCKNGEIYATHTGQVEKGLTSQDYFNGYEIKYTTYIKNPKLKNFTELLINRLNYTGFIEIEFIIDNLDNIYIMEINPRIVASVFTNEYFNHMILPYIEKYKNPKYIHNVKEEGISHMPKQPVETINNIINLFFHDIN
jgi:predicted ATP-grasp superfamily ATP-dependent carboligase